MRLSGVRAGRAIELVRADFYEVALGRAFDGHHTMASPLWAANEYVARLRRA
jgi:hypothetical protein